jgi:excisionase family DNA binding protein
MAKITIDPERLLTLAAAADRLGISRQAVQQAVKEKRLRSIEIGGLPFVSVDELEVYEPVAIRRKAGYIRAAKRGAKKDRKR